ncbi:hypothetical protein J132_03450 [Termitomyces sp. J132]|nr:hypothetical protein H2248_004300 [Termitomyces sp. 'cryptogamus']KNZ72359.1 hypothetical protein J132_03450 [Termitomyces sp. J132]
MLPKFRSTPHTRIPTTHSRHNTTSFLQTTIEVPPPLLYISNPQAHFQHPLPGYPEHFNFDPAVDFGPTLPAQYSGMDKPSLSHSTAYGNVTELHWTRDIYGNVISTIGQIQSIHSDADTTDLENLESLPLPPDTAPPPPPLMQTAQLPPSNSSGGPSGRTSRMGLHSINSEAESWEENELLKEPTGTHWDRTQSPTSGIRRLRDLMSQPQSRRSSPPARIFPDQPLVSSPPPASSSDSIAPQPTETYNRLHTFSPSSSTSSGTRRGEPIASQMHHGIPFQPQSTSSPPPGRSRSPSHIKMPPSGMYDPGSNFVFHPHGLAYAPPPRQSPVASGVFSSTFSSSHPHPELYHRPPVPAHPIEVLVDPPYSYHPGPDRQHASIFDSAYRPMAPSGHYQSQEPPQLHPDPPSAPAEPAPSHFPLPPQWPGSSTSFPPPPSFPPGFVLYSTPETVENGHAWDGCAWWHTEGPQRREGTALLSREGTKGADLQASGDKLPKDHTSAPAAPSRTPLAPSHAQHGVSSGAFTVEDALESFRKRLDTLHQSVIHEHWTNLDLYFKRQTDPAFIAFIGPHTSVSSRIRRLLDKLLGFLAGALSEYAKLQTGSENWHGSWRRQLSSLDRTMRTFCEFSILVCNRDPSFRMLDKVLAKFTQYETKFRDLTKKIHTLLNRLSLRAVHSDLVKAHTKAQEQLKIAGSRRDVPRWDEDKKNRAKLREDFISLQNRLALSRRTSWAESQ